MEVHILTVFLWDYETPNVGPTNQQTDMRVEKKVIIMLSSSFVRSLLIAQFVEIVFRTFYQQPFKEP